MSSTHPTQIAVPELANGTTRTRRLVRYAAVAAGVLGASAAGFVAGGRGESPAAARTVVVAQAYPSWFQNIAKSYGNDPRLTPDFDFASLYTAGGPAFAQHGVPEGTR